MQRLARLSRFDALNRVRTEAVPVSTDWVAGYSVVYGYDVRGLQTSAQFGSGAGITNKFDGFGRPWVSTSNMDGVARSVEWTYITAEGRTQIKHPDGQVFEYAYEATDNLSFVYENGPGSELIKNSFDAFGRRELISRNTGGGSTTTISFDNISRLGSLGHNFDGAATGNDVGIGFSYNPASQVVGRSQTNSSYDYQIPSANQVYTSNGRNQIAQITGTGGGTIGWDANGNLTSDGLPTPTTYTYDAENRLVSSSGAKTATLTYDPMGRLYQVSDAAGAVSRGNVNVSAVMAGMLEITGLRSD